MLTLRTLKADFNEMTEFDQDFFVKLTKLRSINCSNNKVKAILGSLKDYITIKNIDFSNNLLTEFP